MWMLEASFKERAADVASNITPVKMSFEFTEGGEMFRLM